MTENHMVTIDNTLKIEVPEKDFPNEINTLRTLFHGLKQIHAIVKQKEHEFDVAGGKGYKVHFFGAHTPEEQHFNTTVACFFHWFGVSLCNFVRLVGFMRGIGVGDFSRSDLLDSKKFKVVKESIDIYVDRVKEIANVIIWRHKVFGHFAITDPRKDDNIATLDMSVIFPVTFEGRYCVGGMTLYKKNSSGAFTSGLPRWSMTEVFESLEERYWPGAKYIPHDLPPGEKPSHPAMDRILNSSIMKDVEGGEKNGTDDSVR